MDDVEFQAARTWLAARPASSGSPADRAAELCCRLLLDEDPKNSPATALAVAWLVQTGMDHRQQDPAYWYFGTLAAFRVGGDAWKSWNPGIKATTIARQRTDGDGKGSWDPVGLLGRDLGRVGVTALMTMIDQVYYRYARTFSIR